MLCIPLTAALGIGTNYALQALLAARSYGYCAYHEIITDKGGHGTYVCIKDSLPGGCVSVKTIFPPGLPRPAKGRRSI